MGLPRNVHCREMSLDGFLPQAQEKPQARLLPLWAFHLPFISSPSTAETTFTWNCLTNHTGKLGQPFKEWGTLTRSEYHMTHINVCLWGFKIISAEGLAGRVVTSKVSCRKDGSISVFPAPIYTGYP